MNSQNCELPQRGRGTPDRAAPPAPVEGLGDAAQAGQALALSGLHTAVQEIADLVLFLGCQVPRAVQVEGQLPELHQHPRTPTHTCQRACQVGRRVDGQAVARRVGAGAPVLGSRSHCSCWRARLTGASSQPRESTSSAMSNSTMLLPRPVFSGGCRAKYTARGGHLCQGKGQVTGSAGLLSLSPAWGRMRAHLRDRAWSWVGPPGQRRWQWV